MRTCLLLLLAGLAAGQAPHASTERGMLLPGPLASFAADVHGGWLYVYSGHTGPVHAHSRDNLWHGFARLNLHDGATWEALPALEPMQGSSLVAHASGLYLIGGLEAHNGADEPEDLRSTTGVWRFDPLTLGWERRADLPAPRSSHAAAVIGDELFVIGGWDLSPEGEDWHATALSLDLGAADATWRTLPEPPFVKRALQATAHDGRLYVLGGMDSAGKMRREAHVYDPTTGTWEEAPELPFPGFGVAAVSHDGALYTSGLGSEVLRLDAANGTWTHAATPRFPRYFHRLLSGPAGLLAVGGVTQPRTHLRCIEPIALEAGAGPVITEWSVPSPGTARNRQGMYIRDHHLYLFGGNNSLGQHDFEPHNFLSEAWRVSLATLRFEPLESFPIERQSFFTVPVGGDRTLAIGGFGHTGERTRSYEECYVHGPDGSWELSPARLPYGLTQFGLAEQPDGIYLFGGVDFDGGRPRAEMFTFRNEVYRLAGGKWETTDLALPGPRRAYGGALLGDRFYMIGGMRAGFELIDQVDVFDFASRRWSTAKSPERTRISPEVAVLDGRIYVLGGTSLSAEGDFESNRSLEVYDPAADSWTTVLEEVPFETRHARLFVYQGELLVVSTHSAGAPVLRLWSIRP